MDEVSSAFHNNDFLTDFVIFCSCAFLLPSNYAHTSVSALITSGLLLHSIFLGLNAGADSSNISHGFALGFDLYPIIFTWDEFTDMFPFFTKQIYQFFYLFFFSRIPVQFFFLLEPLIPTVTHFIGPIWDFFGDIIPF